MLSGILAPVSATQTPVTEPVATRLMLSHGSRFTADIPATWQIDPTQWADYISPDRKGYILTTTYGTGSASLTRLCQAMAVNFGAGDTPDRGITWMTFRQQIACRVESPDATGAPEEPVGLLFLHPNPLRSGLDGGAYFKYAGVIIDRADFDTIVASMDFSLDRMTPQLYLDAALDIIQVRVFVRDRIDWPAVRAAADATLEQGGDPLAGIDVALQALKDAGDTHSYRWDASQLDTYVDTGGADLPPTQLPTGVKLSDQVGYINLPPMQGNQSAAVRYATTGNAALAEVDTLNTCGWIIDLRGNFGGNTDPMIAAIGEILGDGPFGGFAYSNGSTTFQAYADGSVYPADGTPGDSLIDGDIHAILQPDAAVAVLIGPVTGSAGELTGIAFHGREDTRYFGEPTSDLTTGISGFILEDGAALGLATSAMIDRDGVPFPDGLQPDETVPFTERTIGDPTDPVIAAAMDWLLDQPPCQAG
jgi:hypothetical protein